MSKGPGWYMMEARLEPEKSSDSGPAVVRRCEVRGDSQILQVVCEWQDAAHALQGKLCFIQACSYIVCHIRPLT